jgi:hypothetical protein
MKDSPDNQSKVISTIKEFLAPILLSIVGLFIWRDISEMRSDVKLLLVQQSADRIKIENMESDIAMLKSIVFQPGKVKDGTYVLQPAKKEDELEIK